MIGACAFGCVLGWLWLLRHPRELRRAAEWWSGAASAAGGALLGCVAGSGAVAVLAGFASGAAAHAVLLRSLAERLRDRGEGWR